MKKLLTKEACEEIVASFFSEPKAKCEGCILAMVIIRLLNLLDSKTAVKEKDF